MRKPCQLIQNILAIDKKKRPKTKLTLENVLKNNNRDFVKNKNSKEYAETVINGLISQKKFPYKEILCVGSNLIMKNSTDKAIFSRSSFSY